MDTDLFAAAVAIGIVIVKQRVGDRQRTAGIQEHRAAGFGNIVGKGTAVDRGDGAVQIKRTAMHIAGVGIFVAVKNRVGDVEFGRGAVNRPAVTVAGGVAGECGTADIDGAAGSGDRPAETRRAAGEVAVKYRSDNVGDPAVQTECAAAVISSFTVHFVPAAGESHAFDRTVTGEVHGAFAGCGGGDLGTVDADTFIVAGQSDLFGDGNAVNNDRIVCGKRNGQF